MNNTVDLTIAGLPFKCVKLEEATFADNFAIYVILNVRPDSSWCVLDVGQAGDYGIRINSHERLEKWRQNSPDDNLWVCMYPMAFTNYTRDQRLAMERALRKSLHPICGEVSKPSYAMMLDR